MAYSAVGHRVAAIHEGVDEDAGEAMLRGHTQQSVEMALVRVNAAIGEQAEEVKASLARCRKIESVGEDGIAEEAFVCDGGVDTGHVHADDATRAKIEVADFRVSHLAVGQADEVLAGTDERVGIGAEELVVDGFTGEGDGVAAGLGAVTPSVEDG